MPDINITSHNQKGGITAHTVGPNEQPPRRRRSLFATWVGIATIIAAIAGVIAAWIAWVK